jgi:UDP-N-acetylmuramoyl-tripeptide--D-alanyl-D-alanine ligase
MEIEPLYSCFLRSAGVNTDTRTLKPGQMYWALKGPNFNGTLFARQALDAGASFVVVDEESGIKDSRVLKVENGLRDLQKLAHHHRLVWGKEIVAVCGSNGKTTTKELITRALATEKNVFSTPGNLNNHIGVPLSLLQLKEEHDLGVIEMGANHAREIDDLCYIAEPNSGLITNIGKDHLEGFGTIEKTAKANGELFDFLHHHLGIAFINTTDEWNLKLQSKITRHFTFPQAGDHAPCELLDSDFYLKIKVPGQEPMESQLMGKYNFNNLASALAVASYYKIDPKKALEAVCSYQPGNNRSQIVKTERNTVISDAYNANPSSVLAALENLTGLKVDSKMAVLGDMLELGKDSQKEHAELGIWATRHPEIQWLVTGKEMGAFAQSCPAATYFEHKADLESWIQQNQPKGATILLKGSRGMKLESLLPYL